MNVKELQREIKSLESQAAEEEENINGTGKRMQLDRDLLILQRALNNKVPDWPESQDWKLPLIIDQFQNSQFKAMVPKLL